MQIQSDTRRRPGQRTAAEDERTPLEKGTAGTGVGVSRCVERTFASLQGTIEIGSPPAIITTAAAPGVTSTATKDARWIRPISYLGDELS